MSCPNWCTQARGPSRDWGTERLIKRSNRLKGAVEAGVENCMRQTSMVVMEECGSSMSEEVQAAAGDPSQWRETEGGLTRMGTAGTRAYSRQFYRRPPGQWTTAAAPRLCAVTQGQTLPPLPRGPGPGAWRLPGAKMRTRSELGPGDSGLVPKEGGFCPRSGRGEGAWKFRNRFLNPAPDISEPQRSQGGDESSCPA